MGLGPASIQEGDTIHILPSGHAHFVLRRKRSGLMSAYDYPYEPWGIRDLKADQYELVGDCYLHTKDTLDNTGWIDEEPAVEGSLPFELLGVRYLDNVSPKRETVMLV